MSNDDHKNGNDAIATSPDLTVVAEAADGTDVDNYDALELGIGTTLTF